MKPHWNKIDFDWWERDGVSVWANEFAQPVVLEIDEDDTASAWMTPDEARELAAKLIEAADAVDKAGRVCDA